MVGNLKLLFYNLHIKMMSDVTIKEYGHSCVFLLSLLSNLPKNSIDFFFFFLAGRLVFMAVLGFSLVVEIGGCCLVAMCWLLIAVAFSCLRAQTPKHTDFDSCSTWA